MNWKHWLMGLVGGIIGSVSTSVLMVITDPVTFNLSTGLKPLGKLIIVSGLVSAAAYLKQSPVPQFDSSAPIITPIIPTPPKPPTP